MYFLLFSCCKSVFYVGFLRRALVELKGLGDI
jgi:hypothetical protein